VKFLCERVPLQGVEHVSGGHRNTLHAPR